MCKRVSLYLNIERRRESLESQLESHIHYWGRDELRSRGNPVLRTQLDIQINSLMYWQLMDQIKDWNSN